MDRLGPLEHLDLDAWSRLRLLVVGDLMVDQYLWGRVDRISPEAPVQVVEVGDESSVLGGAGNVVRNLRALGGRVMLAGAIGDDRTGDSLLGLLDEFKVDRAGLRRVPGRRTGLKTRVMAGHQQVVRIDRESREPLPQAEAEAILDLARSELDSLDGLILSDYAKGVLTPRLTAGLIELFRGAGKPVVVDPKGDDFSLYQGADLLTPNQAEARRTLNLNPADGPAAEQRAADLMGRHDWRGLMITRGSQGLTLYQPDRPALHVPAQARQVYDVSGAGDTVIAVTGLCLAGGWEMAQAARLANLAGGLVVGKVGTAAVTRAELTSAQRPGLDSKVITAAGLAALGDRLRSRGRRVVFTNGCFDLLHAGHVHFLQQAKELGEVLIVGLDDDESVARLKGRGRPVIGQAERTSLMAALDVVDYVTVFKTEDLPRLLSALRPDILAKGSNYGPDQVVGRAEVEAAGGRVELIPLSGRTTTSDVVDRLRNGHRQGD